ncbi:LuxR family transcriptional regulator, partial [Kitasatospora nipponensis]
MLRGAAPPLREPAPFGPVVDALRAAGRWLPPASEIDPAAHALGLLLPSLGPLLPADPAPGQDAPAERGRRGGAVRAVLDAVSPVTLVVDDVHWADQATRELMLLLARNLPAGLGLLLTYRREELPPGRPVLGTAFRTPPGTGSADLVLRPLTEHDLGELAAAALGPAAGRELAAALFEHSAALPLIAEEDLLTILERRRHHAADAAGFEEELARTEVPRALREAVLERLAELPPHAVAVVEAAAMLGVPASQSVLTEVAGLPPRQAADGLTLALRAAALHELSPTRYTLRHTLAQQVVYQHILGPRRESLHRQALALLRLQSPPPLVQIAHHTRALSDRRGWLEQASAAADQAVAMGDDGTATRLLNEVLAEPRIDGELRTRASLALSRIAYNSVDYAAAGRRLRGLVVDPALARATRGEIRLGLGLLMVNQAGDVAGFRELEQAADELAERPELAARALVALALIGGHHPVEDRLAWMARAERSVADTGTEAARATVRASRLTLMVQVGDPAVWELLGDLARRAEDREVVRQSARALHNVADVAIVLGLDRRAAPLLVEAEELARESGDRVVQCLSAMTLLVLEWHAGRWEGLPERFAALAAQYPTMAYIESIARIVHAQLAALRGHWDSAIEQLGSLAEEIDHGQLAEECVATAWLARARLAQGDPGAAWAAITPLLDVVRHGAGWAQTSGLVATAVQTALALRDRPGAEELTAALRRTVEQRADRAPALEADLELCRGLLARPTTAETTAGPGSDPGAGVGAGVGAPVARAAEHFGRAQLLLKEIGRPYPAARAAEEAARTLLVEDREQGAARLEEVGRGP